MRERLAIACVLVVVWVLPCAGQGYPVHDNANWLTNLLTQANTLKATVQNAQMIANQVEQLNRQAQSLYYQAQNLKTNPLQLLGQIQGMWNAYNTLMQNAQGVGFNLASAGGNFTLAYPQLAGTPVALSVEQLAANSARMVESIGHATQVAVNTQSVYERLCNELSANQQALTAAQASQGALQIAQAQAQIQALTNEQLSTLTQIEAASSRVESEWVAMQAADRAQGQAENAALLKNFGAQGFRPMGQGR